MAQTIILKGDICYSLSKNKLQTAQDSYLICEDGVSQGVFTVLPPQYSEHPVHDYSGLLITPGLVDLHVHASQYAFRGLGLNYELLDWLDKYTFHEEAKYASLRYAEKAYRQFVAALADSATTRAAVFATLHRPATLLLMELLEHSGLVSYVGKVNMDQSSHAALKEPTADASIKETRRWIEETASAFKNTKPILTPRFVPSCSQPLLAGLGELQKEYRLPVQSHLSENQQEVELVHRLYPTAASYGDVYRRFGLFGGSAPTIMAHCVWSADDEIALMKENGVFVAHCPQSNMNLSSGVAPVRRFIDEGLNVGLGSDMAAGSHLSIFRAMSDAIQASKLRCVLVDSALPPLTTREAFYLATLGGGAFFGKVGSFAPGYEFDAVVLDDSPLAAPFPLTIEERLERAIYLSDNIQLKAKFVRGQSVNL